jgi:hypothetical protein
MIQKSVQRFSEKIMRKRCQVTIAQVRDAQPAARKQSPDKRPTLEIAVIKPLPVPDIVRGLFR